MILCAPPLDPPDITVVAGINDDQLAPQHKIVSNASCTAHCAAPILRILNEAFGIERAFVTSVHAYSNQQRLADVPTQDPRRGRAAAENIIPQGDQRGTGDHRPAAGAARQGGRQLDQRPGAERIGGRPGLLARKAGHADGDQRGRAYCGRGVLAGASCTTRTTPSSRATLSAAPTRAPSTPRRRW